MGWSRLVTCVVAMVALVACGGTEEPDQQPPKERKMTTEQMTAPEETPISGRVGLTASMTGANEVPKKGDPDGTGSANLTLDTVTGQVCYTISVDKMASATAAHVHEGEAGRAGPPVITLQPPTAAEVRCFADDPAVVERVAAHPQGFYVNVHNGEFPDGAIRGQLQGGP